MCRPRSLSAGEGTAPRLPSLSRRALTSSERRELTGRVRFLSTLNSSAAETAGRLGGVSLLDRLEDLWPLAVFPQIACLFHGACLRGQSLALCRRHFQSPSCRTVVGCWRPWWDREAPASRDDPACLPAAGLARSRGAWPPRVWLHTGSTALCPEALTCHRHLPAELRSCARG